MSAEKIISDWKKKNFKSLYWLEGEEDYYIDMVVDHAEHKILDEAEAGFNLTVFYGKDADWAAVVNACKRYPMFAERQVVLLAHTRLPARLTFGVLHDDAALCAFHEHDEGNDANNHDKKCDHCERVELSLTAELENGAESAGKTSHDT